MTSLLLHCSPIPVAFLIKSAVSHLPGVRIFRESLGCRKHLEEARLEVLAFQATSNRR